MPIIIAKLFGDQATMVYAYAFSFGGISQLIASGLEIALLDKIGIESFYFIGSTFCAISLVLLIFLFKEKKVC